VGWSTLLRNLVLAAIAGLVVWQGRYNADQSVVSILAALSIAQRIELIAGVVIIALLAVETLGLINVLNQQGKMLGRLKVVEAQLTTVSVAFLSAGAQLPDPTAAGLHVGNVAPDFRLSDLDGEVIALTSLLALGKPILLVFSDPSCGPCTGLLPEISRWQRDYASTLTIALLSWGSAEANRAKIAEYEVKHVLLLEQEVAETYQLKGTPSAVLIHTDGTIWSPMVLGTEAVRALMERIVELLISVLPVALANESSRNGTALL
jgi:peroxiredoxin